MKTYNYIKIFTVAFTLLALSGCEKFLDIKPKGIDILQGIKHYNGLLNNNMALTFQNYRFLEGGGTSMLGAGDAPLIMGDDMFTTPANFGTKTRAQIAAYRWQADIYEENEDPNEWGAMYVPIYTYNLIANGVMSSIDGTEAKKRELRAEARVNRAFNYLFLVNLYAKPYNSNTASTDLGVPLITEANINAENHTRASVKDVYDFIVKEIEESIPDLPNQTSVRVRLGKAAAWFILGRTYFYMKEYTKAITSLNNSEAALTALPFKVELYDYNTMMNSWFTPALPQMGARSFPTQFNSEETIYMKQLVLVMLTMQNSIFVKDWVMAKFGQSDLRRKHFYDKDYMSGSMQLPGYQRASPTSSNWGPDLPDLYLMRAECKARVNDLTGAKADLETLRVNRMPAEDAVVPVTTQDAMVRFVLDERIREQAGTGMRWFDMRRLADDTQYNNLDRTRTYGTETLTLTNNRLTLKIPAKIRLFNPNMPDNE